MQVQAVEEGKKWQELPDSLTACHDLRAVKWAAKGFRGVNGRRPAKTPVPSIYSPTRRAPLDRCAARDRTLPRAIPPRRRSP